MYRQSRQTDSLDIEPDRKRARQTVQTESQKDSPESQTDREPDRQPNRHYRQTESQTDSPDRQRARQTA